MGEVKCSPGPWKAIENSWQYTTIYDAHDREICRLDLERFEDLNEETQDKYEAIQRADAAAIVLACDHDAALRRAKAEGLKEAEQYALTCLKELQDKICDIELGKYTLVGSQTKEGVAEWVHAKTLQAGRMAKWITARIAEVEADARAAQIEEGE
jgi:hypothetical protein